MRSRRGSHRYLYFFIPALMIIAVILISSSISGMAHTNVKKDDISYKYYTSITIEEGDSLWVIASRYMSSDYANIEEYISEIRTLNQLSSDSIHAGEHLTIPYYSQELL